MKEQSKVGIFKGPMGLNIPLYYERIRYDCHRLFFEYKNNSSHDAVTTCFEKGKEITKDYYFGSILF